MNKEYDFSKMKELKNPYRGKKQAVGINLSPEVVDSRMHRKPTILLCVSYIVSTFPSMRLGAAINESPI
jgi:hypothetical protein